MLDFDLFGVRRLKASGREFERIAMVTGGRPAGLSIDESSVLLRLRQGQVVLIRDAQRELDQHGAVERQIVDAGLQSLLLAPLVFGEEVVGGLFYGKRRPNWYDDSDTEIVRAIADALVMALQHQRLAEEQQRAAVAEAASQQLEQRVKSLRGALEERYGFDTIQGRSQAMQTALGLSRTRFYTLMRRYGLGDGLGQQQPAPGRSRQLKMRLRKRISRTPDFRRTVSQISRPANMMLMSRF